MAKKKSFLVDDPPLNTDFDIGCPFVTPKGVPALNAPVRCKEARKHCERCGWNPQVQRERLVAMVGEKKTVELLEQSAKLKEITDREIAEGKYKYV